MNNIYMFNYFYFLFLKYVNNIMINQIIYIIIVLVIIFSLYHYIYDLYIWVEKIWYSDTVMHKWFTKIKRMEKKYL